jgi:hypothetical protein
MIVLWLLGFFKRNNAVADIDTTLCGNLQVPFDNITKIGIPVKIRAGLIPEGL